MTVLLVDDIPRVVQSVKNGIDWNEIGVTRVLLAYSAKQAREILAKEQVDLLLCDIEMPYQNGFDLLKWCRGQAMDLECIFLTAHADFEYARQALALDSFDYLLQPAPLEDVARAVENALRRLGEKRLVSQAAQHGNFWESRKYLLLSTLMQRLLNAECHLQALMEDFQTLGVPVKDQTVCWLAFLIKFCGRQDAMYPEQMRSSLAGHFGIEAESVLLSSFPKRTLAVLLPLPKDKPAATLYERFAGRDGCQVVPNKYIAHPDFLSSLSALGKLALAEQSVLAQAQGTLEIFEEQGDSPLRLAKSYIRDNLDKDLSRQQIADQVFVHPDHLSRLFKKDTGYSLSEYILHERIDLASRLLAQTRIPVSLVASKAGFQNYSYFSQVFKRITGKSPREHRQNIQENE